MRISDLAKAADVGVETVRFYERKGLIRQPRRPANGGFRHYDEDALRRIRFIRQARDLGFGLGEIEELLSLQTDPAADCSAVRASAMKKRAEVDAKVAQLMRMRESLTTLIEACPGAGDLEFCSILEGLENKEKAG